MLVAEATCKATAHVVYRTLIIFISILDTLLTPIPALVLAAKQPSFIETCRIKLSVTLCCLCLAHPIHTIVPLFSLKHSLEQLALR